MYGMYGMATLFTLLNLALMIYAIYLFHTLAMSNKSIAESMEMLVEKIDSLSNKQ